MSPSTLTAALAAFLVAVTATVSAQDQPSRPDCPDWQACRAAALAAAARGDYETFHDLAWRAVQTGPPRAVDLMFLLARAQSLSGRPHDGLMMLRRIAELGTAPTEALTSEDFRRTRALPGWPEVEALITSVATGAPATPSAAPVVSTPTVAPAAPAREPSAAAVPGPVVTAPSPPPVDEALRFSASGLVPSGLAFDAVSGRFLFGALHGRKVIVVGEQSARAVDLVREESAAFYDVLALAIDPRRGDLWVASADLSASGTNGHGPRAALHKLQLVSGRPLARVPVTAGEGPVRFSDLAVTTAGAVLALDIDGRRIWRLSPGNRTLEVLADLGVDAPVSLTLTGDERTVLVAHRGGLVRIDLATGAPTAITAPPDIDLDGIERLRWHDGSLIAVQRVAEGRLRVVRLRLARGAARVVAVDVLDPLLPEGATPPAVALSGSDFYYTASPVEPAADTVVRRARIR